MLKSNPYGLFNDPYKALSGAIEKASKNFESLIKFFLYLKEQGYSRIDLMIIDSALKKMPLDRLDHTLILERSFYIETVKDLTKKLNSIKIKK
jgi:hypothetical protein